MFQKSFGGTLQKISHACIYNFFKIYPFAVLKMYIQCKDIFFFYDMGSFIAEVHHLNHL